MVIPIIPKKVYLILERKWPALEFSYKGDWVGFMMIPFKRLKDIDNMWGDYFKALRDSNVKNSQGAKNEI